MTSTYHRVPPKRKSMQWVQKDPLHTIKAQDSIFYQKIDEDPFFVACEKFSPDSKDKQKSNVVSSVF